MNREGMLLVYLYKNCPKIVVKYCFWGGICIVMYRITVYTYITTVDLLCHRERRCLKSNESYKLGFSLTMFSQT